jgi:hypothetical protein
LIPFAGEIRFHSTMNPTKSLQGWATIGVLMVAGWMFGGCGGGGANSAGDAYKRYVTALANGDTKAALACIAPQNRSNASAPVQMGAALVSGFTKAEGGLDSVTILKVEVQGDHATVAYQTKTKKGAERSDTGRAEKVQGTWYVAQ